jgi:hypothetical protein
MPTRVDEFRSLLVEFHETFKLPIARSWCDARKDAFPLRRNLIAEEFAEYYKATERIDILDGLGDLTYVVFGTYLTYGIFPRTYNYGEPIGKNEHKLDLLPFVNTMLVTLSTGKQCYNGLFNITTVLYWQLESAGFQLGINLLHVVKLIHASNMTKLWTDDIIDSRDKNNTTAERTPRGWIVKRLVDGKVLKSPNYKPVDLTNL